ncbi:MAG: DUF3857 domain-containing protein [Bacteroidota bacterium]|nr:DUF3857 domain-containing protein [Bacteroidota bacterium]
MKKVFVAILFSSFSIVQCFAQTYQQGLEALTQNKRAEAKSILQKVSPSDKDYANAQLALTVAYTDDAHYDSAFGAFQKFFSIASDPYPYAYALWGKDIFSATNPTSQQAVNTFMEKLSADASAPASLRAMATGFIADKLISKNQIEAGKEKYQALKDLRNWSTVGTFQNISSSGFNKDFAVLEHPEPGFTFTNYIGAPVKWFNIPDARTDRWLDLEYHYDITNAIVYTQTFLQSTSDREVTALLGVSGSVKMWVNDYQVFAEPEERNTDLDVYAFKIKLQKGNNRILLQLGASEINRCNFMLRFADEKGNLVNDYTTTYQYAPYTKAIPYEVKPIPFFAEQFFEQKINNGSATLLDKLMLASIYNRNDKKYEARKISQLLKKEASSSTIISEAMIEAYSRDNNNTDLTREQEFIKSNDPESLYGLILRYFDAFNKEEYDEAQKLLNRRTELYGKTEDIEVKQLNIYARKKDVENFLKELDAAVTQYPDNATIIGMQYNIAQSLNKDAAKAQSILQDFIKKNFNEDMIESLASDLIKTGKNDEAMQLLLQLIQDKPYATMRYSKIANRYYELKQYDKALEWQQKTIDLAPYVGGLYYSKALLYEAANKKEDAINCYKKAIEYDPHNYDSRRKLRELQGKKDLFTNFKENDVNALFQNAPKAEAYPNDNSIYLLKDMQQVIYPENGASEEKDEYLIKIFNQAGINAWKEVNIPYNSYTQRLIIDKTEIFKKDGSKVQAETNDNQLVFSSLEVGDAIHISYKLESSSYGKLSEHFWGDFSFNDGYPVTQARYSLLVPAEKKFNYKMYNSSLQPVITNIADNYKLYVWEETNNAAIESEPSMPSFSDIGKRVVVSSIPDWNYVANWYSDLSNIKAKADFEIKEKVKELLTGKEKLSAIEKAKVIYNYIEDNFNYSNVPFLHSALTPQRASRTLNSRLGDCKDLAVLFTAMAKEAGLDANLVLVDTRDEGEMNVDIPVIGFNHCIAELKADGKNFFVELTDNHLPFGAMPNLDINANGLIIPKDGAQTSTASLIKLNSINRIPNTVTRTSTLTMNGNKADISRHTLRTGAETSNTRASYSNQGEEDQRKELLRSLSSEFNNPITLKSFKITNLDNLKDTIDFSYSFSADKYSSEIAGMQIIKLPWADAFSTLEFVSLEQRKFPFNLWSFSSTKVDKETLTIIIPQGKKWLEIPKNISYNCPSLRYSLTFEAKPGKLIVTREVHYLKEQVPVNEYQAFKNVVNQLTEADKKQLAYK